MKKKGLTAVAVSVLSLSTILPGTVNAESTETHSDHAQTDHDKRPHPVFTWGHPGPSSAALHEGSIRGAGMMSQPLEQMDRAIQNAIEDKVMPGAVVLIARKGTIAKQEAYGYAARYRDGTFTKMDEPVKMQQNTLFDIASISKLFTTTAAMILYEQGQFELDDPVAKYIPAFAQNGKSEVTIRQIMTHTSGFKPWIPLYTMGDSRKERMQMVFSEPLQNEPGTNYTYSDLNMITLGALVERLSGQRLDAFVKDHITKPLGMKNTMYNPPASLKHRIAATEYQPQTNRGLVWGQVHDENAWSLDGVAGHAGVFSTAKDLAIFAHMMLQGGEYKGTRILQPETVDLLVKNQIPQFSGDDHGLGWELNQGWYMDALSGKSTMGHTGFTGTSIVVSPKNDTIAILLTNRVHPTRDTVSTNGIRRQVARLTADAIPVAIPGKGKERAWFSGYGSDSVKTLTAKVNIEQQATLSFETWYRTEASYDYGVIEGSADGKRWTTLGERVTGNSGDWLTKKVQLPANTKFVRFRYETDHSVNGRGWYVHHLKLSHADGTISEPKIKSDSWTLRNY